ncbi:hypothetical protein J4E80_001570 [Alternaria sp. BMP 0032]|nr:hypothetical protein J4E80_001570 [Alternaria sp. BMP 0032]
MDGDVCPLKEMVEVVEEVLGPERGYIVMDEAHSTGVLGPEGRGLVCELGLEKRIFARLHTFGKAVAANGAILLGSDTLRHYLINYARPLIYTTFLSYPSLALIRSSYRLLQSASVISKDTRNRLVKHSQFQVHARDRLYSQYSWQDQRF